MLGGGYYMSKDRCLSVRTQQMARVVVLSVGDILLGEVRAEEGRDQLGQKLAAVP